MCPPSMRRTCFALAPGANSAEMAVQSFWCCACNLRARGQPSARRQKRRRKVHGRPSPSRPHCGRVAGHALDQARVLLRREEAADAGPRFAAARATPAAALGVRCRLVLRLILSSDERATGRGQQLHTQQRARGAKLGAPSALHACRGQQRSCKLQNCRRITRALSCRCGAAHLRFLPAWASHSSSPVRAIGFLRGARGGAGLRHRDRAQGSRPPGARRHAPRKPTVTPCAGEQLG